MSSLNITVEIKAPRLRLIKTQKNQSTLLSAAARGGFDVGRPLSGCGCSRICIQGARLTHIASRRVLISTSDNNYQEECAQNDFFCDPHASPTQGRADNSIGRKGASRSALPRAGSSIKFALPLRCCRTSGKKAPEPSAEGDNRPNTALTRR